ncbi:MAG: hypothetical protein QXO99_08495 [Candidatus Methanomethylicia archaeon]
MRYIYKFKPVFALKNFQTNSTGYVEALKVKISEECYGVNYLTLSVDPDPNALYKIVISKLMDPISDLQLSSIWGITLPQLPTLNNEVMVYERLINGDEIKVYVKSINSSIVVKTSITLSMIEVYRYIDPHYGEVIT